MGDTTEKYWNAYYGEKESLSVPSQFATFVLNEFSVKKRFVDIGCGNGRDSLFFAQYGKDVLGLDGSVAAVESCQGDAARRNLGSAQFQKLDMGDGDACEKFAVENQASWSDALVYARFFLHAIDEAAELNFVKLAASLMGKSGALCLEFRTPRDEFQTKVTSAHYRRYVSPLEFIDLARDHGIGCSYFCEGFGFAKYKSDDAYVARLVMEKL